MGNCDCLGSRLGSIVMQVVDRAGWVHFQDQDQVGLGWLGQLVARGLIGAWLRKSYFNIELWLRVYDI